MALPTLESKEEKYKVSVFQHVPEKLKLNLTRTKPKIQQPLKRINPTKPKKEVNQTHQNVYVKCVPLFVYPTVLYLSKA